MAVFLQILKILGIVLLCILGILLLILILVLFVPIRYQVNGKRQLPDEVPIRAKITISWLLHLLSAAFIYPEAPYIKVKVLGITVYTSQKKEETSSGPDTTPEENLKKPEKECSAENVPGEAAAEIAEISQSAENIDSTDQIEEALEKALEEADTQEEATIWKFFHKLWENIKNIKYTIQKIYDKIKEIIRNIRYYIRVLQSETFKRAFKLCKDEILKLLKSILPGKLHANLTIGTGDPASTGQILAIHGILYPYIGNHIYITPDFENSVVEGDFHMKGKITVFKVLKTAIKVYFNKDIKRVIRLLKREAVTNGRK